MSSRGHAICLACQRAASPIGRWRICDARLDLARVVRQSTSRSKSPSLPAKADRDWERAPVRLLVQELSLRGGQQPGLPQLDLDLVQGRPTVPPPQVCLCPDSSAHAATTICSLVFCKFNVMRLGLSNLFGPQRKELQIEAQCIVQLPSMLQVQEYLLTVAAAAA